MNKNLVSIISPVYNRSKVLYKNFNYLEDLKNFEIQLVESLPILKESGLRLLIENHQDIIIL